MAFQWCLEVNLFSQRVLPSPIYGYDVKHTEASRLCFYINISLFYLFYYFLYCFIFLFKGWIIISASIPINQTQNWKLLHRGAVNRWIFNYKYININKHFPIFFLRYLTPSFVRTWFESFVTFSFWFLF